MRLKDEARRRDNPTSEEAVKETLEKVIATIEVGGVTML